MTTPRHRILAALAAALLLTAVGAPGAVAQAPVESETDAGDVGFGQRDQDDDDGEDDDDEDDDDEGDDDRDEDRGRSLSSSIQFRTTKTAAVVEGDTAWVTVSLRAKRDVDDVRVTATLDGRPVAYPENTVDHSGPYNGYALDRNETDYVAFQITAPQIERRKQNVDLDLEVTWTDGGRESRGTRTVKVPVIEFSGEPYELVTDEITVADGANGWVGLALAGMTPRIDDVRVSIVEPTGLDVHYPQETYTSLQRDAVLEDGETDQANLRLGETHWGQTLDVEVRVDFVVDDQAMTRTHRLTITS